MKENKKRTRNNDLNYIIIKDNHGKKILRQAVYSRVILTFLLILAQLAFFVFFVVKLHENLEYYFGSSLLLSVGFLIYLTNSKGKNEFKIAWMLPLIIFPYFGIAIYLLYHTNQGGKNSQKKYEKVLEQTEEHLPKKETAFPILENNPGIKDLGTYLVNRNFFPYENTKAQYFSCGEDFYPDLIESIKNAKKFIFLETFILNVDESWAKLVQILEQKTNEGVEVRILYDGFASVMASSRSYQKYLESKGIKAQIFIPLIPFISTQLNNRDHRKIYIIDGEIVYTGGINFSNEYFNVGKNRFAYWKDNIIKLQGSAVKSFITLFMQTWNLGAKTKDDFAFYMNRDLPSFNEKGVIIPYGDDAYNKEDVAENIYLHIINNAKKYLHITSPYVLLDHSFLHALIFAAQKGVDVRIIVPSVPDHVITFCIGKTFLNELAENGVKIYLYQKGFIHAKTFISDDKIATVGSVNLDYRSFYYHFECGAILYESPAIADIENDFNETLKDCVEMKAEDYKKLPARIRLTGRIFRIFAPLM